MSRPADVHGRGRRAHVDAARRHRHLPAADPQPGARRRAGAPPSTRSRAGGSRSASASAGGRSSTRCTARTFAERGARMEEALEILRLVWAEEKTSFDGRFWSFPELTVYPRPMQQPATPLWVAGVADAAVDRAARLGDAWMCGPVQSIGQGAGVPRRLPPGVRCELAKPDDWILRRYAWVGAGPRTRSSRTCCPTTSTACVEHWRESVEDEDELDLFRRMDAGEDVPATRSPRTACSGAHPTTSSRRSSATAAADRLRPRAHRVRRRPARGQHDDVALRQLRAAGRR